MSEPAGAVLVAGHLCVDLTPALSLTPPIVPGLLFDVGQLDMRLGGCVANTGRALAALDVPVRASALIGDDELSHLVTALAADEPFAASLLSAAGASTSYSVVLEPLDADRTFWHHAGSNAAFDGTGIDLDGVAILHVGYPSLLNAIRADAGAKLVELFASARERSIVTSLDLAVDSDVAASDWGSFFDAVLPLTDVISPSIDDVRSVAASVADSWRTIRAAEAADDLVARGVAAALVTAGAGGMHLATGSATRLGVAGTALRSINGWSDQRAWIEASSAPTRVTTNGAGDAASAGFLAGIHRRLDPRSAAALAAESAESVITGASLRFKNQHTRGVR